MPTRYRVLRPRRLRRLQRRHSSSSSSSSSKLSTPHLLRQRQQHPPRIRRQQHRWHRLPSCNGRRWHFRTSALQLPGPWMLMRCRRHGPPRPRDGCRPQRLAPPPLPPVPWQQRGHRPRRTRAPTHGAQTTVRRRASPPGWSSRTGASPRELRRLPAERAAAAVVEAGARAAAAERAGAAMQRAATATIAIAAAATTATAAIRPLAANPLPAHHQRTRSRSPGALLTGGAYRLRTRLPMRRAAPSSRRALAAWPSPHGDRVLRRSGSLRSRRAQVRLPASSNKGAAATAPPPLSVRRATTSRRARRLLPPAAPSMPGRGRRRAPPLALRRLRNTRRRPTSPHLAPPRRPPPAMRRRLRGTRAQISASLCWVEAAPPTPPREAAGLPRSCRRRRKPAAAAAAAARAVEAEAEGHLRSPRPLQRSPQRRPAQRRCRCRGRRAPR